MLDSVRMWTEEAHPSYLAFMDEMRTTGLEVIDIFDPHHGHASLDDWAEGVTNRLFEQWLPGTELHLLGFCVGGELLITALPILESRGIRTDYVGLIGIRAARQGDPLRKSLYSLYQVT